MTMFEITPSFRSWMPESSVQGWQTAGYGKPNVNLMLHVPVIGFLHPCWNDGICGSARLVYNDDRFSWECIM